MKLRGRHIDPHAQKGLKEGETALDLVSQTKKERNERLCGNGGGDWRDCGIGSPKFAGLQRNHH